MPKRGDRVAPPPGAGEWDLRYGDSRAVEGWEQLSRKRRDPRYPPGRQSAQIRELGASGSTR